MPYIEQWKRERLEEGRDITTPGELNYAITKLVDDYLQKAGVSYSSVNTVVGVFECAKLELYRRVAASYEDKKLVENGDVYSCVPATREGGA